jgi:DNA polymerase I-like protein with 3'-5' exonuclease and polymerase domains
MLRAREAVPPDEARIILQVHDEILWERGPEWKAETFETLCGLAESGHGFTLEVPLVFEAKLATSWADKGGSGGQVKAGEYGHVSEIAA